VCGGGCWFALSACERHTVRTRNKNDILCFTLLFRTSFALSACRLYKSTSWRLGVHAFPLKQDLPRLLLYESSPRYQVAPLPTAKGTRTRALGPMGPVLAAPCIETSARSPCLEISARAPCMEISARAPCMEISARASRRKPWTVI